MKTRILILIGLVILLVVAVGLRGVLRSNMTPNPVPPIYVPPTEPVACTMDARMCPDGSYVGRTGPHCEFAACPVSTNPMSASFDARLEQAGEILNVRVTPQEVLEDSRCPVDVVCIQAGTVRLRTTLDSDNRTIEQIFVLGQPVITDTRIIELVTVMPTPVSTQQRNPEDYIFTFKVTKK